MKILLIEDDPLWQKVIKIYLENLGDVSLAQNREEVDFQLKLNEPDLVIADVFIEKDSMIEYFKKQKELNFPILFTTAFLNDTSVKESVEIPNSLFISKPIERLTFEASISHLKKYFLKNIENRDQEKNNSGIITKNRFNQNCVIPYKEIIYLVGEGNYCSVKTTKKIYTFKKSLTKIHAELPEEFVRISKSTVVNLKLETKYKLSGFELIIGMQSFQIGRNFKKNLQEKLTKFQSNLL